MKPGFMSSVCPKQTLAELIETAKQYGYQGIEFRVEWGHAHGIELDATAAQLQAARQALADSGITASCIATSVRFNSAERADHLPQRETLRKYIALAAAVGFAVVRVGPANGTPLRVVVESNAVLVCAAMVISLAFAVAAGRAEASGIMERGI